MKLKTILDHMEKWAPNSIIDDWDNTGFQIGREEKKVENILVALDLDEVILQKAIDKNVDLIISHHPIIFQPLKTIIDKNPKEAMIIDIIKHDIGVYNAHSNLDLALGGVSDVLAKKISIKNTVNLVDLFKKDDNGEIINYGYGKIGDIADILLEDFIVNIKESLNIENLILYGDKDKTINKIAVCGGSGSGFMKDAYELGADLFITGDIKYHEAQFAYERDLSLIDIGHFHSEKFILPAIKDYLKEAFQDLNIEVVMEESFPKKIY